MKNISKALLTVSLMTVAGLALAHTQSGALGAAGKGIAATDVYSVNCYDDGAGAAAKLSIRVKDTAPVLTPRISTQASKSGTTALSTDAVDGDTNYSPTRTLANGTGYYTVKVNKEAAAATCKATSTPKCLGSDSYVLEFHCQTSNGTHTGTDSFMTQNQ